MALAATPGVFEDVVAPAPPVAVRDDIAAFVGTTTRGPVDAAVRVEDWDEFVARFGGREGALLLPDAVWSFFENGGRAAYVVRVVRRAADEALHPENAAAWAIAPCDAFKVPAIWYAAQSYERRSGDGPDHDTRSEPDPGAWANGMAVALTLDAATVALDTVAVPLPALATELVVFPRPGEHRLKPGALVTVLGVSPARSVTVLSVVPEPVPDPGSLVPFDFRPRLRIMLSDKLQIDAGQEIAVVEASVAVLHPDGSREDFDELGLHPDHEAFLPRVLATGSRLVGLGLGDDQDVAEVDEVLWPTDAALARAQLGPKSRVVVALDGGRDGVLAITRDDFFDPLPDRERDDRVDPLRGVHQLMRAADVSLVVVPDLVLPAETKPAPAAHTAAPPTKRARFVCLPAPLKPPPAPAAPPAPRPTGLLDPRTAEVDPDTRRRLYIDLARAEDRIVDYCETEGDRVALLCPPPSADARATLAWRRRFDSSFVAAYYPWLRIGDAVTNPPPRDAVPTGVAAGLIARSEQLSGVGRAPANLIASGVIGLARAADDDDFAALHAVSMDVFRAEEGEVRLMGARTLSSERDWRYLHARRLMNHIERVLLRRMTWVVFEANTPSLWSRIRCDLDAHVLRPLFERGAFAGPTPETSYYVRCDEVTNPRHQQDLGRLWCEIGVAPNVPAEYIVFRLAASPAEGVRVEVA